MLAALVDAQLAVDEQHGLNLIKPTADASKQFIYNAPNPKGKPETIPTITQDYDNDDTVEPEISYPDDQWQEAAAKPRPRQYQRLLQHANFLPSSVAGISQAALHKFMGDSYMQELQQSMATNLNPQQVEEVANGVVHPVTNETINKYKKLLMTPSFATLG